jgi:hypothetical protein
MKEQIVPRYDVGAARGSTSGTRRRSIVYLGAFLVAAAVSVTSFYGAVAVLHALDRLSPPPVAGTWCIDSRFTWLRHDRRWKQANLIAVGSSTTWRNLDFEVLPAEMKHRGAVNAAPCFLTVNQVRYMVEYLLDRDSRPATIVTVLTPRDVEGCSRNRTEFFDPDIATQYLESDGYGWWLYFRNFRFKDILLHAVYADQRRSEMAYDAFGSGPLKRERPDAGRPFNPESRCYAELTRLARLLDAKGVQFIAVLFPVMQGWADRHDPSGTTRAHFKSGVKSALAATKAILVDGMAKWRVPDAAFADPVHLQWTETADFTKFVWHEARQQGADLPPLTSNDDHDSSLHVTP